MATGRLALAILAAMAVGSCDGLSGSSGIPKEYVFPGITALVPKEDGTVRLDWPTVPSKSATFSVFMRSEQESFDFSAPLASGVKGTAFVTESLFGLGRLCFTVRMALASVSSFRDSNTREICSNPQQFGGIQSLRDNADGTFTFTWAAAAATDTTFLVYQRSANGAYDFARPIATGLKESSFTTSNLFGMESQCFLVRSSRMNSRFSDVNTEERCTGRITLPGFESFQGCLTATALGTKQAVVTFEFPSVASKVNIYRDKSLVFSSDSSSATEFRDVGLEPGGSYQYTCEAMVNGRPVTGSAALAVQTTGIPTFEGCLSGQALSPSQIRIQYSIPPGIQGFEILRDGVAVFSASASSAGQVGLADVSSLQEAYTYKFRCVATIDGSRIDGTRELEITTLSFSPPVFQGAKSASEIVPGSVSVTWDPATGPKTSKYKIYSNLGTLVDWAVAPVKEVDELTFTASITGLGPQLPWAFGVRACTQAGMCDVNVTTRTLTTQSLGLPPATPGIVAARASNGTLLLTAPWTAAAGALGRRLVYARTVPSSATPMSTTLTDYTLVKEALVANPAAPPTEISVSPVQENTHYQFVLIDEAPVSGAATPLTSSRVFSFSTSKLSPPIFGGASQVLAGTPADTALLMRFQAIAREGTADAGAASGASYYDLFLEQAPFATPLPSVNNACNRATPYATLPATTLFSPGDRTWNVTGLSPRTVYSICLKARDSVGNISTGTADIVAVTQDLSPPNFAGIQGLERDINTGNLQISFNSAQETDLNAYRIDLWKCTNAEFSSSSAACRPPSAGGTAAVVSRERPATHGANLSATTISPQEFTIGNYQTVFVSVSACDDADRIAGGTRNCSVHAAASAKVLNVTEVSPPADFPGVASEQLFTADAQGEMLVKWLAPQGGFTSDYAAFRIYTTDANGQNLALRTTVSCATPGDCPTSGRVTGLDAYRTYGFYVAAVTPAGNSTISYLLPTTNYTKYKRTSDTTPPVFNSSLSISGTTNPQLTWQSASDNQYSSEPGITFRYKVYKKAGSPFAIANIPAGDGTLINNGGGVTLSSNAASLSFTDTTVTEGTWYYTVCALDNSGNQTCDGTVRAAYLADSSPPVLNSLTISRQGNAKSWNLSWQMKDNISVVRVRIYEKASSAVPTNATSCADTVNPATLDYDGGTLLGTRLAHDVTAATLAGQFSTESWTGISGPQNADRCMSYLVRISDASGNEATASLSTYSQNRVTLATISRNQGNTAGGRTVVLTGTGFSVPTVTIGGSPCGSLHVVDATRLTCITPVGTLGAQNVIVRNEDGSEATLTGGYTYSNSSSDSSTLCNLASWAGDFAGGSGTAADPFIICTTGQFGALRQTAPTNYRNPATPYSFKLGDNLDFSAFNADWQNPNFYPIGCTAAGCGAAADFARLHLDGNSLTLANFHFRSDTFTNVGLFNGFQSGSVKRVNILSFEIQGRSQVGMLFGSFHPPSGGSSLVIEDISASGTVKAGQVFGGIAGGPLDNGQSFLTYNRISVGALLQNPFSGDPGGAGGVAGSMRWGSCTQCMTNVELRDTGGGGIANIVERSLGGPVTLTSNSAKVTLTASTSSPGLSATGGLVGNVATTYNASLVMDSSSARLLTSGLVSTAFSGVGGLVGIADGPTTISRSFATGRIYSLIVGNRNGGLVGDKLTCTNLVIQNSYTDIISGPWGGGMYYSYNSSGGCASPNVFLSNTYSTVNAQYGLAYRQYGAYTNLSVTKSFWLYDTTTTTPTQGVSAGWNTASLLGIDAASRSLTHAQMAEQSTFSTEGWDFSSASPIWFMPGNGAPPQLVGVPTPPF